MLLLSVVACIPNEKLIYFPNPEFNTQAPTAVYNNRQTYQLQPRDVLSVRIKTLDEDTEDYFNIQPSNGFMPLDPAGLFINGYSISSEGMVTLPEVGEVQVGGYTLEEAEAIIRDAISSYISDATILVKLVSFKVTVLGEVNRPGYYYVFNEQANVLEVLGLAGDLTDFGNRENITLIRQTENGSDAILLNLKDPKLLASDFYFLQPNDVLYIQPLQAKQTRDNLNTLSILGILFGAVSSTILVLNFINN
ncbi:polysaccharide biosynthesis/export family protein [Tunicatimonas pelagia]|uniref:polysaccharide biosynthesis/export family protein n=1 Tax=Tunicatimonas pelagia TaxID=931531 RepID=UPI002664F68A|nr:polysaccharide biosynthesis/export family protein [Tunicatimonas pelagia]WKN40432.1 polysaccharide biosynthesis/export family protein [Tunicatimonas pelagia]